MKNFPNSLKLLLILVMLFPAWNGISQQTLKGTVLDENGDPIPRGIVKVYNSEEDLLFNGFTDLEGDFVTNLIVSEGTVTSNSNPLKEDYYLSYIYPNPANTSPLYFKYRGKGQSKPEIEFYNLAGAKMQKGKLLQPGIYAYRANFGASAAQFKGLLSIAHPLELQVELINIESGSAFDQIANDLPAPKNNLRIAKADTISGEVRIEIEKAQYVTLSEIINTELPESIDQSYQLSLAPKPTASFEIITEEGKTVGDLIKFDASASVGANDEPLRYSWSFGDGVKAGQMQVPHIYSEGQSYTIELTVIGAYGASEILTKVLIIDPLNVNLGSVAIRGVISDVSGNPMENVEVYIPHMDSTFISNSLGEVGFNGFVSGKPQMLKFSKLGFISEYYSLDILDTVRQGYFEISLIEREPAIIVPQIELGGTVTGKDGTQINLPVEGLVHADGSLVTGEIEVYMTPVDVSNDTILEAFPGNFSGISFEGNAPLIMTFGTTEYTFMQGNEELQLASDKEATIDIPIYVENDFDQTPLSEGMEFPMWFYDESSGNWVKEGTGIVTVSSNSPTGFALRGDVNHFSWWNHDIAPEPWYAIPECKVQDKNGLPTLDIPSGGSCYINGRLEGPSGPRSNRSAPNCCQPLPCPPGVPIIFAASGGNGLYKGSVSASGSAGTTTSVVIGMNRVAGYGVEAGAISPDTVFNSAIETVNAIDAYTVNLSESEILLLSVGQATNSNLEGIVTIRDPDNLPIESKAFNDQGSAVFKMEIVKSGDYQVIVDGTANEPGAYTVSLRNAKFIELNSNTEDSLVIRDDIRQLAVELDSGQLINVAIVASISGRIYLNLIDPSGNRIFRRRGTTYIETGVRKLEKSGIYLITVEGVDSNSQGNFIIGLSSIEEPQPIETLEIPYSMVEGEISIIGDKQFYSFTGEELQRKNFAIHSIGGLTSRLRILKPGEQPFYQRSLLTETYRGVWADLSYNPTLEDGEYIIEIKTYLIFANGVQSMTGNYEAFIFTPVSQEIAINSQIADSLDAFFDQINEFRQYTFTGSAGQVINVARVDEIAGRTVQSLFDPEMKNIKNTRDNSEFRYVELPMDGKYTIEIDGVDRGRSQGPFVVGLTTIEQPTEINFQAPFVILDGAIDIVGRHKYYSLSTDSLERFNVGFLASDSVFIRAGFKRFDETPFYKRSEFSNRTTGPGQSSETGPFSMPFSGELVLDVDGLARAGESVGAFQIYVGQREVQNLNLDNSINGVISQDLGLFDQFLRYKISSPASNNISINFAWDNPGSFPNRVYLSVFTIDGERLYRRREFNSSIINLPASGEYIVEVESVDNPNDQGFSLIVNTE